MKTTIAKKITSAVIAAAAAMTLTVAAVPNASAERIDFGHGIYIEDDVVYFPNGTVLGGDNWQFNLGEDALVDGTIFKNKDGYYSVHDGVWEFIGTQFTFTDNVGKDEQNRDIYVNDDLGYFYIENGEYHHLGNYINVFGEYCE